MISNLKPLLLLSLSVAFCCLAINTTTADESADTKKSTAKHHMTLQVEINRPSGGRGYRRPYVSVWLEDKDRFPVRTIALWVMQKNPGPRWYPDLRQWYKGDRMRLLVDESDLIDGMSGATRGPGKYKIGWDGNDNVGNALPAGKYTLYVEAAREHGTYKLIKQEIEIGDRPFKKSLAGNVEVKAVEVEYAPPGSDR